MAVHPSCVPIASAIPPLLAQRDGVLATLATLPPLDRWKALAEIGTLDRQIAEKQLQLDECQRQNQAGYEIEVVVLDTAAGPTPSLVGRLWNMSDGTPTLVTSQPVVSGAVAFATPPAGAPLGVTIQDSGPGAQGPDFRFGPLDELPRISPDNPTGRIEIVIGPPQSFTAADINRWFGASLPQHTTTALTGDVPGNVELTVSTLEISLGQNTIQLEAAGTANVTGALWGSQLVPFEVGLPLRFVLPPTPETDRLCDVAMTGSPTLSASGLLGSVLSALVPFLRTFVGGGNLPALRSALNEVLPRAVGAAFGLEELPPGAVASLRRIQVTPTAITIVPSLGAFGDALSTFQP